MLDISPEDFIAFDQMILRQQTESDSISHVAALEESPPMSPVPTVVKDMPNNGTAAKKRQLQEASLEQAEMMVEPSGVIPSTVEEIADRTETVTSRALAQPQPSTSRQKVRTSG